MHIIIFAIYFNAPPDRFVCEMMGASSWVTQRSGRSADVTIFSSVIPDIVHYMIYTTVCIQRFTPVWTLYNRSESNVVNSTEKKKKPNYGYYTFSNGSKVMSDLGVLIKTARLKVHFTGIWDGEADTHISVKWFKTSLKDAGNGMLYLCVFETPRSHLGCRPHSLWSLLTVYHTTGNTLWKLCFNYGG